METSDKLPIQLTNTSFILLLLDCWIGNKKYKEIPVHNIASAGMALEWPSHHRDATRVLEVLLCSVATCVLDPSQPGLWSAREYTADQFLWS